MKLRQILATCAAFAITATAASAQEGIDNASRNTYLKSLAGKRVIYIPLELRDNAAAWHKALKQQADALGYTVEIRDPNWNTDIGARALSSAISEKADLIVLQNPDVQSYARLIKKAQEAGIKIIEI